MIEHSHMIIQSEASLKMGQIEKYKHSINGAYSFSFLRLCCPKEHSKTKNYKYLSCKAARKANGN